MNFHCVEKGIQVASRLRGTKATRDGHGYFLHVLKLFPLLFDYKFLRPVGDSFAAAPVLTFLLGGNPVPEEGLAAPTPAPERTKLCHCQFGGATSRAGDSTDTNHLLGCLCFCSFQSSSDSFISWAENSISSRPFGVCGTHTLGRLGWLVRLLVALSLATWVTWIPKRGTLLGSEVVLCISDTRGLLPGTHKCPRLAWAGQLGTHRLSVGGTYTWDHPRQACLGLVGSLRPCHLHWATQNPSPSLQKIAEGGPSPPSSAASPRLHVGPSSLVGMQPCA